jgi:hypothetical protein
MSLKNPSHTLDNRNRDLQGSSSNGRSNWVRKVRKKGYFFLLCSETYRNTYFFPEPISYLWSVIAVKLCRVPPSLPACRKGMLSSLQSRLLTDDAYSSTPSWQQLPSWHHAERFEELWGDEIYEKNSRIHLDRLQITKEIKITPILEKFLEYKRNWIQYVNRMPRNILRRVMKRYSPTGRRNHGRPLKRLLGTWDRKGSRSGPTLWQIYYYYYYYYYYYWKIPILGFTPGGSSTVHIYTQTTHRTTKLKTLVVMLSGIRTQSGQTKISDELTA